MIWITKCGPWGIRWIIRIACLKRGLFKRCLAPLKLSWRSPDQLSTSQARPPSPDHPSPLPRLPRVCLSPRTFQSVWLQIIKSQYTNLGLLGQEILASPNPDPALRDGPFPRLSRGCLDPPRPFIMYNLQKSRDYTQNWALSEVRESRIAEPDPPLSLREEHPFE
jgi:hypothetical protein